ncbi:hypothetical protein [Aquimarina sp. Aq107]|uniref:hypothetical protein n=1 Tax=Aquimarina sp. Aq107 TaxID=1191912 RepID=UPI000D550356|nr:hypothetical protein [Aquimarina sp. Aq107]
MKIFIPVLLLFFLSTSYGQESFNEVNDSYEIFLKRIIAKDTLIKNRTKYYECSEDLSGRIELYYLNDKLRLMTHIYKQGFGNDVFLENYFLDRDKLKLKTSISEIIYMNTVYKESSQGVSSASAEKVIEVTEQRMYFENKENAECFERKHGKILADWDQKYFDALPLEKSACIEDIEDVRYKYRILRKAEKKLENYSNRKRRCIFYIW